MFVDSPVLLAVGSMIIILTVALVVVRWVPAFGIDVGKEREVGGVT